MFNIFDVSIDYIILIASRNEHMKHESQCSFIRLGKSDETTWTVNELFDLFKRYMVKECVSIFLKLEIKLFYEYDARYRKENV